MRAVGIWVVLMLAACDPHVVFDKAMARTAESVIAPVTGAAFFAPPLDLLRRLG